MKKILPVIIVAFLFAACAGGPAEVKRFPASVEIPEGFEMGDFEGLEGITMSERYRFWNEEDEVEEMAFAKINVYKEPNVDGYESLAQFLQMEFDGYNKEFAFGGVFVDQGSNNGKAKRAFFFWEGDEVYQAHLEVRSQDFNQYNEVFEGFVESIVWE